ARRSRCGRTGRCGGAVLPERGERSFDEFAATLPRSRGLGAVSRSLARRLRAARSKPTFRRLHRAHSCIRGLRRRKPVLTESRTLLWAAQRLLAGQRRAARTQDPPALPQTGRVVGRFGLPTLLDLLAGTNVHDVNKKVLTFTA